MLSQRALCLVDPPWGVLVMMQVPCVGSYVSSDVSAQSLIPSLISDSLCRIRRVAVLVPPQVRWCL